jgi:hypothetical protein
MTLLIKTLATVAVAPGSPRAPPPRARGRSAAVHRSRHRKRARTQADRGPPLPEGLAQGVFWAQYRVENLRIVPVFGAAAVDVSPRIGHLHITVDDLRWW